MITERWITLLCGFVALAFGLYVFATRRAAVGDDNDEPHLWFYG